MTFPFLLFQKLCVLCMFYYLTGNYPGQFSLYHAPLSSAMSHFGSAARVSSIFQPCFFAVERSDRITAKSAAPAAERKPPEIFWRSFIMRAACSAKLLVNGTVRSERKRKTSCL